MHMSIFWMSHILENLDILSEGFPENKYSIKIKSYIILTFQKLLAPLQCHFWLGNTQYFGFWRIHSIFTPPSLPSHLYLVNILLMCGMTEHIIYSWGNEGPSSVFRIKRIMIWGLWWWCDDQKNSCTVRLGFGFNSTVYRIVLQKMHFWCRIPTLPEWFIVHDIHSKQRKWPIKAYASL